MTLHRNTEQGDRIRTNFRLCVRNSDRIGFCHINFRRTFDIGLKRLSFTVVLSADGAAAATSLNAIQEERHDCEATAAGNGAPIPCNRPRRVKDGQGYETKSAN